MDFPRLSGKEYTILDLLRAGGEQYGLELVRRSDGALKRGTIYVTLGRMEDKGLIRSRTEKSPSVAGLPRRLYEASGEGIRALQANDAASAAYSGAQHHA